MNDYPDYDIVDHQLESTITQINLAMYSLFNSEVDYITAQHDIMFHMTEALDILNGIRKDRKNGQNLSKEC